MEENTQNNDRPDLYADMERARNRVVENHLAGKADKATVQEAVRNVVETSRRRIEQAENMLSDHEQRDFSEHEALRLNITTNADQIAAHNQRLATLQGTLGNVQQKNNELERKHENFPTSQEIVNDVLSTLELGDDKINASSVDGLADAINARIPDLDATRIRDLLESLEDDEALSFESLSDQPRFQEMIQQAMMQMPRGGSVGKQTVIDLINEYGGGGNTQYLTDVIAGTNVTIDKTDPQQPVINATGSGGTTDHGALNGLADDDHTQYALADGTRGEFAAIQHTHNISNINNLQSTLDDKANRDELFSGDYLDLINRPNLEALDNVDTFPTRADFPEEGSDDRFYIAADTNSTYRWNGTDDYVKTNGDLALGETPQTAYRGDRGKIAYDHSQTTVGNPHKVSWNEIEGELENPENPQDPAPKSYVDANAGTTKQYFSSSEEKTDTLTPSSERAEETFTLSSDRSVQKVILNRLVLLDDEWTQDGTSLTVSPDAGFETTDKIVVYQQSPTAANAVGASDYIDLISDNGTIYRLTVNDDGNVITTQQ